MRLIEIQDGVLIDVDKIEGVKAPDDRNPNCIVYTHHRKYETTYPYQTLISMLREGEVVARETSDNERMKNTMDKLDAVLGKVGYFAG